MIIYTVKQIYVLKQFYYGEFFLVDAYTDREDADNEAQRLNEEYGDETEHYYEIEGLDLIEEKK